MTTQTKYDLENRTLLFAKECRLFINSLKKTIGNIEDGKQLVRSSGSVGANYREANESISKKDFLFRVKICRKEAKESKYWLDLLDSGTNSSLEVQKKILTQESIELMNIFGSIIRKSEKD